MTTRTTLPDGLSAQGFAIADALALGASPSRLRGSDLDRPFWGVRSARGAIAELPDLGLAYFSRHSGPAAVSHVTAAKLWGIPLPWRWDADARLHVAVPPSMRAPRGVGVAGHHLQLHPTDVVERFGLRTTTQARTLCDLASLLREEELLAAADYLLWWRRSDEERLTRSDILSAIDRHPTSRGVRRLRTIEPLSSDRSDSPPESVIRYRIHCAGLPRPEVNLELHDSSGAFLAMPDLAYPDYLMALDYEGDHHRTDADQWEKDIHRAPRLQDAGWHYTRLSRSDLSDSGDFLARLTRNLRTRGWSP